MEKVQMKQTWHSYLPAVHSVFFADSCSMIAKSWGFWPTARHFAYICPPLGPKPSFSALLFSSSRLRHRLNATRYVARGHA